MYSGYYEWNRFGDKRPFYIHSQDGKPLYIAALYSEAWGRSEVKDEEAAYSQPSCRFAVITTDAAKDIGHLHDRMPVILDSGMSKEII